MKYLLVASAIIVGLFTFKVGAAEATVSAEQRAVVDAALVKLSNTTGRTIKATDIKTTPVPGLLQVTADASVFYVSTDGLYVVAGEMLDVNEDLQNWSLTEQAMRNLRVQMISQVPEKDMVIFPAKGSKIGTVTVFTDIDCSYCRKMQSEMTEYNDLGIEIRYLAYPRAGKGSESYKKAVTVWCSDDKQRDMNLAKQGKDLPMNLCADNPVDMELELGKRMGVSGTPTLIFSNGAKVPGYMEPAALKDFILEEIKPK